MSMKIFVSCDPRDHSKEEKLLTSVPGLDVEFIYTNGANKAQIASCQAFIFCVSLKSLHANNCYQEFNEAKATLGLDKIYATNMEFGVRPNYIFPATHEVWTILSDKSRGGYGAVFKRVLAELATNGVTPSAPIVDAEPEDVPGVVEEAPVEEAPVEEAPVVEETPVEEAPVVDEVPDEGGEVVDAIPDEGGEIVDVEPDDEGSPFNLPDDDEE